MGSITSAEEQIQFDQKLQFIQVAQDQNFGRIEIFRSKEPPYQYIMNYNKTFLVKDDIFSNFLDIMKKLKDKNHKNLAKLHFVQDKEENHMCIKNFKISSFFNYYNFTLRKAIDKKKVIGSGFPEPQLWYVFCSLLQIGKYLKTQNISLGDYTTSKIFLTPEGYIKIYLLNIYPQNKHNSYYSVLAQKQQFDKHLLSPEQLLSLQKNSYELEFDVYKSDVFSIAMIMLELIFLDEPKFYYNSDHFEVNFGRIKYNLATIKGEYTTEFQTLLSHCLEENPKDRLDFDNALAYIEKIKKNMTVSGSIRLVEDQESELKKRKSNQAKKQESFMNNPNIKNLPSNLDQRLMVTPISTYSDKKFYQKDPRKRISNPPLTTIMQSSTSSSLSMQRRNRQLSYR